MTVVDVTVDRKSPHNHAPLDGCIATAHVGGAMQQDPTVWSPFANESRRGRGRFEPDVACHVTSC